MTGISGLSAAVPYVIAVEMGERTATPWGWVAVAAGGLLTLLAVALPAWDQRRHRTSQVDADEAAALAQARLLTTVHDTLTPIARHLVKTASSGPDRRAACQSQLVMMILQSMIELGGVAQARACWFELDDTAKRRRLVPAGHQGRAQGPTTVFAEGTVEGQDVFDSMDLGEGRVSEDVDTNPPAGWGDRRRQYKCFLAVPVKAGDTLFGMLTLDSKQAGALTGDIIPLLHLLAALLASALAEPASRPPAVDLRREDARSASIGDPPSGS